MVLLVFSAYVNIRRVKGPHSKNVTSNVFFPWPVYETSHISTIATGKVFTSGVPPPTGGESGQSIM